MSGRQVVTEDRGFNHAPRLHVHSGYEPAVLAVHRYDGLPNIAEVGDGFNQERLGGSGRQCDLLRLFRYDSICSVTVPAISTD